MHYGDIIIAPVITEKASIVSSDGKTYVFKCNKNANKFQIKDAVEKAFGVKVAKVTTLNTKAKNRRVGRYTGKTNRYKKAIVKLAKGSTISFD